MVLLVSQVVAQEIDIRSSLPFDNDVVLALDLIIARRMDLTLPLPEVVPLGSAKDGCKLASECSRAINVLIEF